MEVSAQAAFTMLSPGLHTLLVCNTYTSQVHLTRVALLLMAPGFREAEAVAKTELSAAAFSNAQHPDAFRQDLLNIAKTTLSSKILTADKEHFAELAVEAISRLKGSGNLEAIHIIKKTGGALKVRHGQLYQMWRLGEVTLQPVILPGQCCLIAWGICLG